MNWNVFFYWIGIMMGMGVFVNVTRLILDNYNEVSYTKNSSTFIIATILNFCIGVLAGLWMGLQ